MTKIQVMWFEVITITCKKKCFDIYQFSLEECFCSYSSVAIAFWKNYIFWGMYWNRRVGNPGPLPALPRCTRWLARMDHISEILGFQLGQPMGPPTISLHEKSHWAGLSFDQSHRSPQNSLLYMILSRASVTALSPRSPGLGVGTILLYSLSWTMIPISLNLTLMYGSGPFTNSPGMLLIQMCHRFSLWTLTETVWLQMSGEALNPGATTAIRFETRHLIPCISVCSTIKQQQNNIIMKDYLNIRQITMQKVPREALVLQDELKQYTFSPSHPIFPAPTFTSSWNNGRLWMI